MARVRNQRKKAEPAVELRDASPSWPILAVRIWLAAMFGATLWVTRPLWQVHDDPPMLPLVELPAFQYFGYLMFAGYAAAVRWPRAGLAASVAFGLLAMAADQTRMQPTIFSLWLLMLGTWSTPKAVLLARCHVASLWLFSGIHKLLSDGYFEFAGPWLFSGIFPPADWPRISQWHWVGSFVMAAFELVLGIAAFVPRLRKPVAVGAGCLHLGIVVVLHRLDNWNTAVWPWNLALAVAAPWLMLTWKDSLAGDARSAGRWGLAAGLALALSPALYYIGLLDPYLSHCLYSSNVPRATFMPDQGWATATDDPSNACMRNLNVPFPPAHRNFEIYFRRRAIPGDTMDVYDPRDWARRAGYDNYRLSLEGGKVVRRPLPKATQPKETQPKDTQF